MKENKKSGMTPETNGTEEKTKGFPVVTEEDEANAATFEMKKKTSDGSWVAAAPVTVSGERMEEPAEPKTREPLEDADATEEIEAVESADESETVDACAEKQENPQEATIMEADESEEADDA